MVSSRVPGASLTLTSAVSCADAVCAVMLAMRSITSNENSMLDWSKSKHQLTSVDTDEVTVELKGKYIYE